VVRQTEAGSTWQNLPWLVPSYVSVVNGNQLQILPDGEYEYNNASFTTDNANIAINVTVEVASSQNSGSYGGFAIGYGVNYPSQILIGNYEPAKPYGNAGIVVVLEHGAMADYHLFLFYNGQIWGNWSVGSFGIGQQIGIGFLYTPPNEVQVFWYNGTLHTYTVYPVTQSSTGFKAETLTTVTSSFTIDVSAGGPVYGYGQWVIINYQYDTSQTIPPYSVTFSWTAVTMGNGVRALYAFTDADNPVNVTTNATSWSVVKIESVENLSVTNSIYPVSGSVTYTLSPKGIYLIADVYPSGDLNGWYLNVTIEFQFVTPEQTIYKNITVPVFISAFAVSVSVSPPQSSYLSGQTITVTNTTTPNYPSNLGYQVISPPKTEINIQGLTNGFVPLPYTITKSVSTITTYNYIINVIEGGFTLGSLTGTITIYPVSQLPVIFVSQYPQSVTQGTKVTITFQFTDNAPVSNVTASAFTQTTSTFAWTYASLVSSSSLIEFKASWSSSNDGFIIITKSSNYLIPFNGSAGIDFANNGINTLQIQVNPVGQILVSNNQGQVIEIVNSTPVIGLGFYYGAGPLSLKWFFADGIILQTATANQAYTILVGTSPNTMTQYTSGYTNASGYGQVTVTLTSIPYELIEIYWGGVQKYVILNISVLSSYPVSANFAQSSKGVTSIGGNATYWNGHGYLLTSNTGEYGYVVLNSSFVAKVGAIYWVEAYLQNGSSPPADSIDLVLGANSAYYHSGGMWPPMNISSYGGTIVGIEVYPGPTNGYKGPALFVYTANEGTDWYQVSTGPTVGQFVQLEIGLEPNDVWVAYWVNGQFIANYTANVTPTLSSSTVEVLGTTGGAYAGWLLTEVGASYPVTSNNLVNTSTLSYNYTNPFRNNITPTSSLYNFSNDQPWAMLIGIAVTVIVTLLGWKFGGKAGASGGAIMGLIAVSYLGLMPWYIFYIFIFAIAMLLAKIFVDRFMGSDE
jgi:hypothetical protein